MHLPILCYGHPLLRKQCEPVGEITEELRQFIYDMIETMDPKFAIGLSAIQVGRLLRIFTLRNYVEMPDGHWTMSEPKVFINPQLSNPSQETWIDTEGCVSIPKIRMPVERPISITIEALDINGNPFKETLEGINARVRMHENDHLNGTLFIDRLDPKARKAIEPRLREIKKTHKTGFLK